MRTSEAGRKFIHGFESLALVAYPDPGSRDGKPWTIGWGTTAVDGRPVYKGMTCTREQADEWFERGLAEVENGVEQMLMVDVTQGMFDALVSFAYNVGLDDDEDTKAEGLGDSTLLRKLNAGDYAGASAQFPLWNINDGKVMRGLTRRRAGEREMFDSEGYPS